MSPKRVVARRALTLLFAAVPGVWGVPQVAWSAPPDGEAEATPEQSDPSESGSDTERARQLAAEGRQLYWQGDYQGAIEAFLAAYELAPDPNLLFNISAAYEKLGDYDAALEYLERYAPDAPADEKGAVDAKRRELQEAKAKADQPEDPEPEPQPEPQPQPQPPQKEPLMGALGWSLVGVTVLGVGVGTGFGVASLGKSKSGREACTDENGKLTCPGSAKDSLAAARRNATIADVAFGVAVLAAVGVVTLIGVRLKHRKKEAAKVDVAASLGGVGLRF